MASGTPWRTGALVGVALLATGCFEHHLRAGASPIDATVPAPDAGTPPAPPDAGPPDGGTPPACGVPVLGPLHQLTDETPPDHLLSGLVATDLGAIAAWASTNTVEEYDRPYMVRAIGGDATPLGPATAVLEEPTGWYYSGQPRVAPVAGGIGVLAFDAGRGCRLRTVDDRGRPTGAARVVSPDPCIELFGDDGDGWVVGVRRGREGESFVEALHRVTPTGVESIRPAAFVDRMRAWSALDQPGRDRFFFAHLDGAGVGAGRVIAGRWERRWLDEAFEPTAVRVIDDGPGIAVAWIAAGEGGVVHTDAVGDPLGDVARWPYEVIEARGGLALTHVGGRLAVLHVEGADRDTRLVLTRLDADLGVVDRTVLHEAWFIGNVRAVDHGDGALVAFTKLVEGVGHQVFAAAIECDAAPADSCAPMNARPSPCFECDDVSGWTWDGHDCRPLACNCTGDDCDATYETLDACRAAHAECDPELCRATDGRWLREPRYCVHPTCGLDPTDCARASSVCHCGPERAFRPGIGCQHTFDCRTDEARLCAESGGRWEPVCCHSECGMACPDACTAMACTCPVTDVFDPMHGCVRVERCMAPASEGEACDMARERPCDAVSICCATAEGARCRRPLCDEDDLGCL